jgi:hypothetical protein
MGNAQTHCLQLPNLYLFAHFGKGGSKQNVELAEFGDNLLPGLGVTLAEAWQAIAGDDPQTQQALAETLRGHIGRPHRLGPSSGLLFGDADRFLGDVADNLMVRAVLIELESTLAQGDNPGTTLRRFLKCFRDYQERIGFVDTYAGTLYRLLNEPLAQLGDARIDRVLQQFNDWRNPSVRHQTLLRLLKVLEEYCDSPHWPKRYDRT